MRIEHYELNPNKTENKISVKIIKANHILHSVHVLIKFNPLKIGESDTWEFVGQTVSRSC